MIEEHISLLLRTDVFFKAYWEALTPLMREDRLALTRETEAICGGLGESILAEHAWASEKVRRYLSCVPQEDFEYDRRPKDWFEFLGDEADKARLCNLTIHRLTAFLDGSAGRGKIRLYGGVKPLASLDASFVHPKSDRAQTRRLRDTWDAVRFRMVCANLVILRTACVEIWQYFIDEIVRCRNYFVSPGNQVGAGLYRAVHFELQVVPNRWVELQVITELRDWIGFLDYSFSFKKSVGFLSREHEEWLLDLTMRANVADARGIPDTDVRTPLEEVTKLKPPVIRQTKL
jgi:hypothetical protein